jgi:hypothetical protein
VRRYAGAVPNKWLSEPQGSIPMIGNRKLAAGFTALGITLALLVGVNISPAAAGDSSRGPAAGADKLGNEYVFWKGTDGNLWEAYWNTYDRSWKGPNKIGMGPLGSEPTVAVSPTQVFAGPGGNLFSGQYVYWTGTGPAGHLWMAYWDGSWHGPIDLGMGALGSQPAASASDVGGRQILNVYWEGNDGNVWYAYSTDPTNASSYSGPHAASRSGKGLGPLGSSPAASSAYSTCTLCNQDDIVTWWGTNSGLWFAEYNVALNSWDSGAQYVSGAGSLGSAPSVAVIGSTVNWAWKGSGNQDLWVFSNGQDKPADEGMGPLGSAPAIAVNDPSGTGTGYYLYVFWKGTGSSADLFEAYYSRNDNTWHGPINLGMGPLG